MGFDPIEIPLPLLIFVEDPFLVQGYFTHLLWPITLSFK